MQMLSCPKASRNPFKHLGLRLWVSRSSQNVQPGVNKQKWTKHPVFNLAAECSGQAVFLTVGQKCFNWEPCFESSWVVLKMKRCSSFSHTRGFCERHSGILTRTTLLSWRTPSTLCAFWWQPCLCWVRWDSSGHNRMRKPGTAGSQLLTRNISEGLRW